MPEATTKYFSASPGIVVLFLMQLIMLHKESLPICNAGFQCGHFCRAVVVFVEALSKRVNLRMTIASASTLSMLGVRALKGGEGIPNMFCLVASTLGHLRRQCWFVCGSFLQRVRRLLAIGCGRLSMQAAWPNNWEAGAQFLFSRENFCGSKVPTKGDTFLVIPSLETCFRKSFLDPFHQTLEFLETVGVSNSSQLESKQTV